MTLREVVEDEFKTLLGRSYLDEKFLDALVEQYNTGLSWWWWSEGFESVYHNIQKRLTKSKKLRRTLPDWF